MTAATQFSRKDFLDGVVGSSNALDERGDYDGALALLGEAILAFNPTRAEIAAVARRLRVPATADLASLLAAIAERYYRADSHLTALQVAVKVLAPDSVQGDPSTAFHPDHDPDREPGRLIPSACF